MEETAAVEEIFGSSDTILNSKQRSSQNKVYKMLYKMSLSVSEIPPLFVQLDQLEAKDENEHWKEKARWIRFEEQAEDVLGRWSKPHVATLPQTSIDELKELIANGKMMLDVLLTDIKEIADAMANELLDYFKDLDSARRFAEILCLPHHHHHEKKVKKTASGNNLHKMISSSNFADFKKDTETNINEKNDTASSQLLLNHVPSKSQLKYQYSFTDSIILDDFSSIADFKENTKFKKKVHRKAEGATILVMPVDFVQTPKLVFLRLEAATELPSLLEVRLRSRFIVLIIGPIERQIQLYEVGRATATCLADDVCRELFYSAQNKEEIMSIVKQFNRGTMVIPPSEWNPKIRIEPPETYLSKEDRKKEPELTNYIHDDDSNMDGHDHADPTLKGSKKPFNGILEDIKRKMPFFVSDFTDCLNLQCVATTLYMYLVSLCSLVAFGGMLGKKTGNYMATIECILAGSVCGVFFSLFAGQPLNIISATGPMLILEGIIKSMCDNYSVDFMEFRLWIGLWTSFFLVLIVMFNLSFLVKYITRFTEDCFATLVAIIFIIDAVKSTLNLRHVSDNQLSPLLRTNESLSNLTNFIMSANQTEQSLFLKKATQETNFYFSIILFIMTFTICSTLKSFRTKPYLPSKIREVLSDFAVLISIVLASLLDNYVGLTTQKLTIPSVFQPTKIDERGWLIPFFKNNAWYTILIAMVPALIATILVFMDQQITAVIINRKEFKLKKSSGYHLDLFIIAAGIAICSILGLPWFVAATVLALTHVNSLKMMSENTAPGERPIFMGVREQRMTTLLMSILVGLSVFLTSVLAFIPMAVLYGVFMFMGVAALNGMQFFDRFLILFMPAKYQPDFKYLRHVNTKRVHMFTIIQVISTSGLYLIKYIDSVAILFPVLVLATCGIRKLLDFVFTQRELFYLDDILPGTKKHKEVKSQDSETRMSEANGSSNDNIYKKKSDENSNFLSKTNHYENEPNNNHQEPIVRFIDENNNTDPSKTNAASNSPPNDNQTRPHQPVKFVTSFTNIKEDDDD